jgi:hypothetical protein
MELTVKDGTSHGYGEMKLVNGKIRAKSSRAESRFRISRLAYLQRYLFEPSCEMCIQACLFKS